MTLRQIVLGTLVVCLFASVLWNARGRSRRRHTDIMRDDSLRESFPASDPPATQDFAIPANRA